MQPFQLLPRLGRSPLRLAAVQRLLSAYRLYQGRRVRFLSMTSLHPEAPADLIHGRVQPLEPLLISLPVPEPLFHNALDLPVIFASVFRVRHDLLPAHPLSALALPALLLLPGVGSAYARCLPLLLFREELQAKIFFPLHGVSSLYSAFLHLSAAVAPRPRC